MDNVCICVYIPLLCPVRQINVFLLARSVVAEAENVIVFGSSKKTNEEENVGMYGNGLKSGSMRLGKDMMVFTKKDEVLTCLMISRTFFKEENVTQVEFQNYKCLSIVPFLGINAQVLKL